MINALNYKKDIKERREQINMVLDRFLPRKDDYPKEIHKAMRYTLFAGGKRIRPYLTILTYQLFKRLVNEEVLKAAAAVELLHTYTLIHDDLPEIDNDDFRRGKKTCHVLFGSNIALLSGDALLIEAFNLVNNVDTIPETKIKMINDMAVFCGERGLIAGQMQDILSKGADVSKNTIEFIHLNKTSKLLQLCTRFGAHLSGATSADFQRVDEFGKRLGLAFQITDDILDVEGTPEILGKPVGRDESEKKATYPSIFGMERSKQLAEQYTNSALSLLDEYGNRAYLLKELTNDLLQRRN